MNTFDLSFRSHSHLLFLLILLPFIACQHDECKNDIDGKLVYDDPRDGILYTSDADGCDRHRIFGKNDTIYWPNNPFGSDQWVVNSGGFYPRWSPDGRRILCSYSFAFDTPDLIVLMNSDGSQKKVIGTDKALWSPSGSKILIGGYSGITDSLGNNYSSLNGSNPFIFNGDSLWYMGDLQWGPTDDLLYMMARNIKNPSTKNEIYSVNISTGQIMQQITDNSIDESGFLLSPDGQRVAFPHIYNQNSDSMIVMSLIDDSFNVIPVKGRLFVSTLGRDWNWCNDSRHMVIVRDDNPDLYRSSPYLYSLNVDPPNVLNRLLSFQSGIADLFFYNPNAN